MFSSDDWYMKIWAASGIKRANEQASYEDHTEVDEGETEAEAHM